MQGRRKCSHISSPPPLLLPTSFQTLSLLSSSLLTSIHLLFSHCPPLSSLLPLSSSPHISHSPHSLTSLTLLLFSSHLTLSYSHQIFPSPPPLSSLLPLSSPLLTSASLLLSARVFTPGLSSPHISPSCPKKVASHYSYTLQLTLYTVNCTVCTVNCELCTVNCELCTVNCELCTVHCALCYPAQRAISVIRVWAGLAAHCPSHHSSLFLILQKNTRCSSSDTMSVALPLPIW